MPFAAAGAVAAAAATGLGATAGTAALIGAGASVGAGLLSSSMQSGAVSGAADQNAQLFNQQRNDLAPWRDTGARTLGAAADLTGINGPDAASAAMGNFQQSPGYEWQLGQGVRAIQASKSAQGLLGSGATAKALETYGQGLADQEFGNYWNRLLNLSQQGLSAGTGGAATANAAAASNTTAAGQQASIYGNTGAGIGGTGNALLNNSDFQRWLKGTGGSSGYDPSVYGFNAGGAGAGALQGSGWLPPSIGGTY